MTRIANAPTVPGHFWAIWKIKDDGTADEDEPCSGSWEIVQVFENHIRHREPDYLRVHVPGVEKSQSLENFHWGDCRRIRRD